MLNHNPGQVCSMLILYRIASHRFVKVPFCITVCGDFDGIFFDFRAKWQAFNEDTSSELNTNARHTIWFV